MPLISCPDCSKQVSDQVAACIHCGCPLTAIARPSSPAASSAGASQDLEHDVWSGSPSQKAQIPFYVVMGLLSFLVIPLILILIRYLTVRCTKYAFTNRRLTIKTGILSRSTEEIELFRVKDTGLEEPLFMRLFGLGHILVIPVDATASAVGLFAISNPEKVRLLLRDQVNGARSNRRTVTMEAI